MARALHLKTVTGDHHRARVDGPWKRNPRFRFNGTTRGIRIPFTRLPRPGPPLPASGKRFCFIKTGKPGRRSPASATKRLLFKRFPRRRLFYLVAFYSSVDSSLAVCVLAKFYRNARTVTLVYARDERGTSTLWALVLLKLN